MSFDCKYKIKDGQCLRLRKECSPGEKGCILHGKYDFPLKETPPDRKEDERRSLPVSPGGEGQND